MKTHEGLFGDFFPANLQLQYISRIARSKIDHDNAQVKVNPDHDPPPPSPLTPGHVGL